MDTNIKHGAILHVEPVELNRAGGPFFRVRAFMDGRRCYQAYVAIPGLATAIAGATAELSREIQKTVLEALEAIEPPGPWYRIQRRDPE